MNPLRVAELLERVRSGEVDVAGALSELRTLPFADLGYARVDHHRALRQGVPEIVFGQGKTPEHIAGVVQELVRGEHDVLVTRLDAEPAELVLRRVPELTYVPMARVAKFKRTVRSPAVPGTVAVVTAGTSDIPVAEEAAETLEMCDIRVDRIFDVGVAGLHRVLAQLERLNSARAVIVAAGMEGALPSVLGGLLAMPIIAVPTSIGYGVSVGGYAALMGMLSSCASGLTVVNIDNGFGAAMAVVRMVLPAHSAVRAEAPKP